MTEKRSIRTYILDIFTAQLANGDASLDTTQVVADILNDPDLTASAVEFAVRIVRTRDAVKLVRGQLVRHNARRGNGGSSSRFVAAIIDYGLSLLDVEFGAKRLGDYLPAEAIAYAAQQHESARTVGIQARFVASVAKACPDSAKPIREQITNERAEAIRQFVVESSPNKEAAAEALAVA